MTAAGPSNRPRLFIDGRWHDTAGPSSPVLEAASEELLGRVTLADTDDVDAAVQAARRALSGPWGSIDVQERCALLDRFADALRSRAQQTAELVSRENRMPIALSRVANGLGPAAIFRYYSRLLRTQSERDVRIGKAGRRTLVQRHPVGVVAAITPWNYPQGLAAMKLAPALAAGCTVVLKPAPETALDAYAFADAAIEAELPAGVLNIVPGGRQTGADLVAHRDVDKVAFTGSTNAGREIGAACGGLLRPVTLELGGKSAATQDIGQRDSVGVVRFLARHRGPLPVAGHRHRVDRVDRSTGGPQHADQQAARGLDRDRDRVLRVVAGIGQHGGQFGETGHRLGYAPFGYQPSLGIHNRDVVMILGPVDPTRDHGQRSSSVVE